MLPDEIKYNIIEMDDFERRKWKKITKIILKRIRKKFINNIHKQDSSDDEKKNSKN